MDKQSILLEKLRSFDSQHISFFEAKKQLLAQGFSDQQIAQALYTFSYDGRPNSPKKSDPTTAYYAANPKEARRIGAYILNNAKAGGYGRKAAYYAASRYAPGHHAKAKYALMFADEMGYPYFSALFSLIPSFVLAVRYDLPGWIIYIGPGLVTLYWLLKLLWRRFGR
jgi:hypothetical protein